MRRRNLRGAALLAACLLVVAPAAAAPADDARFARAHRTIRATAEAQAQFDRALAFLWAFSIAEARLRFRGAADADPSCAMCRWGEALTETTDINYPQTGAGDVRGANAIADAKRRAVDAPADERALIDALALRFVGGTSVEARESAYADAMDRYTRTHPDDATGFVAAAYARWIATDRVVNAATRQPTEGGARIQRDLDRALALDPEDLGARHLRIHLEEDLERTAGALPDARFFDATAFAPGMSHLPHMAGHVYARLGMWEETIVANARALANDDAYTALGQGEGWSYLSRYHTHDADFLAYGLTSLGRSADAVRAMEKLGDRLRADVALRNGDDAMVLTFAKPGDGPVFAALRSIALARGGNLGEARAIAPKAAGADGWLRDLVRAAVARAAGDVVTELMALKAARGAVAGYPGDPKTAWFDPPGEAYGAALLRANRAADAEAVFREETVRFPNDPRLEFGLAEALRAQHKDDAAPRAAAEKIWRGTHPLGRGDLA